MENKPLTSIRGVAALWVVALHITDRSVFSNKIFSLGYTAVDLFFILSGLILSKVNSDLKISEIGYFWLKRICRIYPAHVISLLVLTMIVFLPLGWSVFIDAIVNTQYIASIFLLQSYISLEAAVNPVAWSVGVELGCYLLFPLAIICARRIKSLGIASIFILVALLKIEWEVCSHFSGATHGIPAMSRGIAGFSLGMVIWRISSGLIINSIAASFVEGCALVAIGMSISNDRPDMIPIFSAALLFALSYDNGLFAILLRSKPLLWLGSISFSIYLIHYPVLLIVQKWLPIMPNFTLEEPLRLFVIIFSTLMLSSFSYRFVEKPGRSIPAFLSKRRIIKPSDASQPSYIRPVGLTLTMGTRGERETLRKDDRV